jgi:cytochrome P450
MEYMIDECIAFLIASTQSTSQMLYNALYYLSVNKEYHHKCTKETNDLLIKTNNNNEKIDWVKVLTYDNIQNLNYIGMCTSESLRIDNPVLLSFDVKLKETIDLCGFMIKDSTIIHINIWELHHNPDQWINHKEYIPERFDPESKYYLTPSG